MICWPLMKQNKYLWSMWMIIWHTMQKSRMWQWYIAKLTTGILQPVKGNSPHGKDAW